MTKLRLQFKPGTGPDKRKAVTALARHLANQQEEEMTVSGWIGVDLDGTLAHYGHWNGSIGEPVPAMVERVKAWLAEGVDVRIFTARVGVSGAHSLESNRHADDSFANEQRAAIEAWCEQHIGQKLPITATKDFAMIELWDDRAITVQMNTGRVLTEGRG